MAFQEKVETGKVPLLSCFEGSPLLAAFEILEVTMGDKNKKYIDKVQSLMSVLNSVVVDCLSGLSTKQILLLFQFLYKHTLSIILHGDWLKNKAIHLHMGMIFKRFETITNRRGLSSVTHSIKYVLELLKDPWGATIKKIINKENYTEKEVQDLLTDELDFVLILRIEIMIAARCDCQALQLVESCLQCVLNPDSSQVFVSLTDNITTIKDLHLLLLVRTKDNVKLPNEISKMNVAEGLDLVRRCSKGQYLTSLKKSLLKMVEVVTNMILASAMIQPVSDKDSLEYLIEEWFNLYTDTLILFHLIKNMSIHAISSCHIYLLVRVLVKKYAMIGKNLCIELYIRAFTVNLNEIEKYKLSCNQEEITKSEIELSIGFLSLAEFLKDDIITCRECVLTSFSLDPTSSCYEKIKELAISSGALKPDSEDSHNLTDNAKQNRPIYSTGCQTDQFFNRAEIKCSPMKCPVNINQQESFEIASSKIDCRDLSNVPSKTSVITSGTFNETTDLPYSIHISDADQLGIPQRLCDDLSTVICSARYQLLNWNLDWIELSSRCQMYKTSGKKLRNSEMELKYLQIDYSQFKNTPKDTQLKSVEEGFVKKSMECNDGSIEYTVDIPAEVKEENAGTTTGSDYELSNVIYIY